MRVVISFNSGEFVNSPGDRIEIDKENNMLYAYNGPDIVCVCDMGAVIVARISEKGGQP